MKFNSDKEFSEYIEQEVSKKVEKHYDVVGNQIINHILEKSPDVPFNQSQINFLASIAHNYSKAGAKFGALTALEMVQNLNQKD